MDEWQYNYLWRRACTAEDIDDLREVLKELIEELKETLSE